MTCCSLLTFLNSFEISSLLLSAEELYSAIIEYLLFMVEHLFAAETIGLSLPAEKAAGLMILVDDDKANASAAPR